MPYTALISDLHLTRTRPEINRVFFEFLQGPGRAADALYILGDLFEYWAGDDDLGDPLNARVAGALKGLVEARVPVYLMHGNRDFLMLEGFVLASGVRLLEDPTVVDLYGTRTVLLHGDTLCTEDKRYQAFRRHARKRFWQRVFLLQPLWLRRFRIERARVRSERRKQAMGADILDVASSAVEQTFRDTGCARMVHGHTHRPARHDHVVDWRRCERWVLADWYHRGQYLRVDPDGWVTVDLA